MFQHLLRRRFQYKVLIRLDSMPCLCFTLWSLALLFFGSCYHPHTLHSKVIPSDLTAFQRLADWPTSLRQETRLDKLQGSCANRGLFSPVSTRLKFISSRSCAELLLDSSRTLSLSHTNLCSHIQVIPKHGFQDVCSNSPNCFQAEDCGTSCAQAHFCLRTSHSTSCLEHGQSCRDTNPAADARCQDHRLRRHKRAGFRCARPSPSRML